MFDKIKLDTKSKFSFECHSKSIISAVNKAVTVSAFSHSTDDEKHHFLVASQGKLFVIGYSTETFICLNIPDVTTAGKGCLGFVPHILLGLIKNRNELIFSFDNGKLSFNAAKGKYSASMNTLAVTDDHTPHVERMLRTKSKGPGSSMSSTLLEEIRKGVKLADLKDYYNDEQILCAIRVKKGLLDVSSHDNFHMAYYKAKVSKKNNEFELAIPVTTFKLLDRFISDEEEDADFFLDSKHFRIVGKTYMVSLPPVQVDEDYFDRVPGYVKSLTKPFVELKFDGNAINTVDNMFTISEDDSRLSLSVASSGNVDISLSTENGKITDGFKSSGLKIDGAKSVDFMIDPRIFADLFSKVKDRKEVPMRLFSKRNKGVSSCFMISASAGESKAFLVGTYYEE